jgi:hypothetical protein
MMVTSAVQRGGRGLAGLARGLRIAEGLARVGRSPLASVGALQPAVSPIAAGVSGPHGRVGLAEDDLVVDGLRQDAHV